MTCMTHLDGRWRKKTGEPWQWAEYGAIPIIRKLHGPLHSVEHGRFPIQ